MDARHQKFYEWLIDNGAKFPKIIWPSYETQSGIRGAVAAENIETNEVMFEIPIHLMMCEPNFQKDDRIGDSH